MLTINAATPMAWVGVFTLICFPCTYRHSNSDLSITLS